MIDVGLDGCPICDGSVDFMAHGVVAPFICELTGIGIGQPCEYRQSRSCGLRFFDCRYTDAEMKAIYSDYREGSYVSTRRRWEPWYLSKVNDAYGEGTEAVGERSTFVDRILTATGRTSEFNCAVDYGGDRGQFFPAQATGERLVCDVSDRLLLAGVERIATIQDLGHPRADLIIMAHVLEHLPEPAQAIHDVKEWLADGGILYVEVPMDGPAVHRSHSSGKYGRYLDFVATLRGLFMALDFFTGVVRQLRSTVPRLGL